ncbi:MAG: outer membrane beta-barrel protein [Rhabdochlamydiaceae bacterium]|nr:outer membrane beta-barrel protein [Rhabdochlamydiaceae bacterium]
MNLAERFKIFIFLGVISCLSSHGLAEEPSVPPSHHTQPGDWFTRVRGLYVLPNDSSGSVSSIPHSGVSVHPSWTGEIDVGYMFTKNLGIELIASTTKHTLMGKKVLSGTKIGTTWLLPPTLTLQWRFLPTSIAQPYIGAGVNYTLFYNNHCSLPKTHIDLKHSWGPAVQAGLDVFFYKDWLINFDVKYVWIDTRAHLNGGVNGSVHVDVNPWLFGIGIGRKW